MPKSGNWWRTQNYMPMGVTHSGNGTASAFALNGQIIIDYTDLGSGETLFIKNPFAFQVIDVFVRVTNGQQVGSKLVTLRNDTTAISSTMAVSTDKGLLRATTLDSAEQAFAIDDDDLSVLSSAHGDGDGRLVVTIIPA